MATASSGGDDEKALTSSSLAGRFKFTRTRSTTAGNEQRYSKLKNRALSAWNNLRNGWVIPTHLTVFGLDDPIWILGAYYHGRNSTLRQRARTVSGRASPSDGLAPYMQDFLSDFQSRFWLTYRRGFPEIAGSELTTDCGWGCMLRSGQMILAQALVCLLSGRGWRTPPLIPDQEDLERRIVRWFTDVHQQCSPFSIHTLVELSAPRGRCAGQWYGPALVSYLMRDALEIAGRYEDSLRDFKIYVAQDCTVYKRDVYDIMDNHKQKTGSEKECAVLILVPVRLGGETLNEVYFPCLKGLLTLDHCVGVIGGRPRHSLYFIGFQGDELVYLDPHCCQEVVDTTELDFPTESFHCKSPRKLPVSRMDPSCTIGFFVRDRRDFDHCCETVMEMLSPPMQSGNYPFFTFSDERSVDRSEVGDHADGEGAMAVSSGGGAYRAMATFTIKPQKSAASLAGEARIHVEPVLSPAPDHVVDDFVVLDMASTAGTPSPMPDDIAELD